MAESIWTARAEADLQREFESLEDFQEGKGYDFIVAVDAGVRLIRLMPGAGPMYHSPFHRLVLRNPRYGLFYVPESRGVVIHAICNLRQDKATIVRHLDIRE